MVHRQPDFCTAPPPRALTLPVQPHKSLLTLRHHPQAVLPLLEHGSRDAVGLLP
jgi:hypothetical protein